MQGGQRTDGAAPLRLPPGPPKYTRRRPRAANSARDTTVGVQQAKVGVEPAPVVAGELRADGVERDVERAAVGLKRQHAVHDLGGGAAQSVAKRVKVVQVRLVQRVAQHLDVHLVQVLRRQVLWGVAVVVGGFVCGVGDRAGGKSWGAPAHARPRALQDTPPHPFLPFLPHKSMPAHRRSRAPAACPRAPGGTSHACFGPRPAWQSHQTRPAGCTCPATPVCRARAVCPSRSTPRCQSCGRTCSSPGTCPVAPTPVLGIFGWEGGFMLVEPLETAVHPEPAAWAGRSQHQAMTVPRSRGNTNLPPAPCPRTFSRR